MDTCVEVVQEQPPIYVYVYIYIYKYICVYMCMCMGDCSCTTSTQVSILKSHIYIYTFIYIYIHTHTYIGGCSCTPQGVRLLGSLKTHVSFAKEPYKRDYILQNRPIFLRSLLIVATPYRVAKTHRMP